MNLGVLEQLTNLSVRLLLIGVQDEEQEGVWRFYIHSRRWTYYNFGWAVYYALIVGLGVLHKPVSNFTTIYVLALFAIYLYFFVRRGFENTDLLSRLAYEKLTVWRGNTLKETTSEGRMKKTERISEVNAVEHTP